MVVSPLVWLYRDGRWVFKWCTKLPSWDAG